MKWITMMVGAVLACTVLTGCITKIEGNGFGRLEAAGLFTKGFTVFYKTKEVMQEDGKLATVPDYDFNWNSVMVVDSTGVWGQSMGATGQALRGALREASDRFQITYNRNNNDNNNENDNDNDNVNRNVNRNEATGIEITFPDGDGY